MCRADRVSGLVAWAIALVLLPWAAFATLLAPGLIRSAYRGESLPTLNRLISGQAAHPLEEHLAAWNGMARRAAAGFLVVGILALVLTRPEERRWIGARPGSDV